MIVQRSALVARPAATLFDLIEAAEHYPQFLPWCTSARIVHRDDTLVAADLGVAWRGLKFEMRTRNPKRRPDYMAIHLEQGPFRHFEGEWQLRTLAEEACKVSFRLDVAFDSRLATQLAGRMIEHMADTLVDAFVLRALAPPAPG